MKKERPRGQIKDLGGGTFRIAVPLGKGLKGERPYHHETLHNSTPAKARKKVTSILASVDDGTFFEPSRMPLKDMIALWRERKVRKGVKRSTLETYDSAIRTHIEPVLGEVQLRQLNTERLQGFFDRLQDAGMMPSTMRIVFAPIKQVFDLAVRYNHLKDNPCRFVELPPMNEPKKAKVFDEKEVFRFISAAASCPDDFIFLFALVTGVRPCEFLGLQYPSLQLVHEDGVERGLCLITDTLTRSRHDRGWYLSTPKTEKGRRPVYFPAFMYHALDARRESHLENLRRLGKTHQLVFTNTLGDPYDQSLLGRGRFLQVLKRAGIPTEGRTLYTLRRSSATFSMFLGESVKELSDRLGHRNVQFTQNEYVDVLPVMQRTVSDRLENFLFRTNFAQHGAEGIH